MAKILIASNNLIAKSMVGTSIRSWEFARELSQDHEITLISNGEAKIQSDAFKIISIHDPDLIKYFQNANFLITQRLSPFLATLANRYKIKVIIDAYDPSPLELLELFKTHSNQKRCKLYRGEVESIRFSFELADGILCASSKQKDFWTGFLMGQKQLIPSHYETDSSLGNLIKIVPFGLPTSPPKKNGKGLRELYQFSPDDKILLWAGGIWDWFDPLSLIKAMKLISEKRKDIKLVFMGVKPPDPTLTIPSMSSKAIQLAESLSLRDKTVFFNLGWIPYDERQNFLLDADIGISTHFNHLETQFSFRTRILDYFWSLLPIITTEGDSFADLVQSQQLGSVVPYENPEAIAQAIVNLLDDPTRIKNTKKNLEKIRKLFSWPTVLEPLKQMIDHLNKAPYRQKKMSQEIQILWKSFREKSAKIYRKLKSYIP